MWPWDPRTLGQVWNKRWMQKHTDSQALARTWRRVVFSFAESLHSDWMWCNKQNGYLGFSCCFKARKLSRQFWYWTSMRLELGLCQKAPCESNQSENKLRNFQRSKVWNLYDKRESSEWTATYIRYHLWIFDEEPLLCVLMLKPFGQQQ